MLADQLDYSSVLTEPRLHRWRSCTSLVARSSSRRRSRPTATATRSVGLVDEHAPGRRAFAVEGTLVVAAFPLPDQ